MNSSLKQVTKFIAFSVGRTIAIFIPYSLLMSISKFYRLTYTYWISPELKKMGKNCIINPRLSITNGKYIMIGENTIIGKNVTLSAWDKFRGELFNPTIEIGNKCLIGDDSHITAINKIKIGNGVLMGKKITITDNSHGTSDKMQMHIIPLERNLYSKGSVIIEDNVWIGEKVTILPNTRIGKGAIIGANAVVVKDVPEGGIVVGTAAKIIRII